MLEAARQASPYIVPVLLSAYILLRAERALRITRPSWRFLALLISVPVALVPVGHVSISLLVRTISPGYSLASMGFLAALVVSELRGSPVMREPDWTTLFGFNIVMGGYLFLSILGLDPFDAYAQGYDFSWIFVVTAVSTIALIIMKNPMALVYILAIAAWDYHLLAHSRNFFDYIIDGPLFIVSVLGMLVIATNRIRDVRTSPTNALSSD
jgi:hypothetical protein